MKRKWILILIITCFFLPFDGCVPSPAKFLFTTNLSTFLLIFSIFLFPIYLFISSFLKNYNHKSHLIISLAFLLINYINIIYGLIRKTNTHTILLTIISTLFIIPCWFLKKKILTRFNYFNICEIIYLFIAFSWIIYFDIGSFKDLLYGAYLTNLGLILYLGLFLYENKLIRSTPK